MSEELKIHIHHNWNRPLTGGVEQDCLLSPTLKLGSGITMHMHEGDCPRCVNGHCHYPNITLLWSELDGQLYLTFENCPPPAQVEFFEHMKLH